MHEKGELYGGKIMGFFEGLLGKEGSSIYKKKNVGK